MTAAARPTATPGPAYAGVVPSAGASIRMGRPKGLLPVGGESFLKRTVGALRTGGCAPVLVVVAEGAHGLAGEAEAAGAQVLVNPDPGEGPITSLRLALSTLGDSVPGFAYLPVDHPMVRGDTVSRLLDEARAAGAPLTVPMYQGKRGHPAIFGAALFPELLDASLEGGARTVVHRHLRDALKLEVDDPGVLVDIDTPDAYRQVAG